MSASQFLQYLTQIIFVLLSLVVTRAFVQRPTPTRFDIAAFFAITTLIIIDRWLVAALTTVPPTGNHR